jgi:hypothetical protein
VSVKSLGIDINRVKLTLARPLSVKPLHFRLNRT